MKSSARKYAIYRKYVFLRFYQQMILVPGNGWITQVEFKERGL